MHVITVHTHKHTHTCCINTDVRYTVWPSEPWSCKYNNNWHLQKKSCVLLFHHRKSSALTQTTKDQSAALHELIARNWTNVTGSQSKGTVTMQGVCVPVPRWSSRWACCRFSARAFAKSESTTLWLHTHASHASRRVALLLLLLLYFIWLAGTHLVACFIGHVLQHRV